MKVIEREIVSLPSWALPYLVNGDASGLEAEQLRRAEKYLIGLESRHPGLFCEIVPLEAPEYFTTDAQLEAACYARDCEIAYLAEDPAEASRNSPIYCRKE